MAKKITNEQIYGKILEIEDIVKKIAQEEEIQRVEEEKLEKKETKELELLSKLHGKNIKKRFEDILKWKEIIWDKCPDKKIKLDSDKEADFLCRKTGKSCRFIDCYRNKVE